MEEERKRNTRKEKEEVIKGGVKKTKEREWKEKTRGGRTNDRKKIRSQSKQILKI